MPEKSEIEVQIDTVLPEGCRFLTTEQIAKVTQIAPYTFRLWRSDKSGGPNFVKLGRLVRYPRQSCVDWWNENASQIPKRVQ